MRLVTLFHTLAYLTGLIGIVHAAPLQQQKADIITVTSIRPDISPYGPPTHRNFPSYVARLRLRITSYFEQTWKRAVTVEFSEHIEYMLQDVEGGFVFHYSSPGGRDHSGFVAAPDPPHPLTVESPVLPLVLVVDPPAQENSTEFKLSNSLESHASSSSESSYITTLR
ncbi:hypothetical protein J3R30DRAFT_3700381 [Lentinula aciculospora]|uniref:Uncharacterized protein n=1 Tax=Lentinula aciculospora TaxID=153920 RepID=A0A9W9AEF8_9AGAR|nr:hypothetical protein J3R30DRAFT_3700381 [Lentinula aciculospora]